MEDIRSPDKKDLAYEDYLSGMKYKDIAEKHEVSLNTVKSWKTRYKWSRDSVHTKEKVCVQKKDDIKISKEVTKASDVIIDNEDLTDKQQLFCMYYIKNFNASLAATRAGYSPDTARQIGYENLTKPHIKAEIQRLKKMKKDSIMLDEDDIIERYMNIAFADMTDFITFGREEVPIIGPFGPIVIKNEETGEETELKQIINVVKFKESNEVDGGLICEVSQGKNGTKLKLEDRQKALDWLGKYFLMNPLDRHKIDYDDKKLAIEKAKVDDDSDITEDDGFIDALKGQVDDIWQE